VGGHQYPPGSKFPKHGCIFLMGRKRSEECHMAYLFQISENDFNKKNGMGARGMLSNCNRKPNEIPCNGWYDE
jgi:hypothetical protein